MMAEEVSSGESARQLTVTIIAGAAEDEIRVCLESVKWADEIVVVNSVSKDRTAEIAHEYTDKVLFKEWEGYGAQKQFALDCATNEWVLSLDSDERVSDALRSEIENILTNGSSHDGFYIPRRNYFLGRWIKHCGWYPGYQLRLFRKSKAKVNDRRIHEAFVVGGSVGYLACDIIHHTHPTIRDTLAKVDEYSTLKAQEKVGLKRVTFLYLIFHPFVAFVHSFFFKQGFRDGVYGLMVSIIHAITDAETCMKIWEMQNSSQKC
jgi:glycosyltransferase involved in cell wall biosynthesis